jgi:CheY-like chemotaxis protein
MLRLDTVWKLAALSHMARILLVEDDPAVREFVRRALAHNGHDVIAAADGLEALDLLGADDGELDLMLSDIVMPGMDGIALSQRVSESMPSLPILLMSGYAAERQRAHNVDSIIHRVIRKPFTLREICDAVDEALATGEARGSANGA